MKIKREEVEHTARLARLTITPEDAERLTGQLNSVLTYMDKLGELDTTGIEPMAHALSLATPMREDKAAPSMDPDRALDQAPQREGSFFLVPKVI